MGIRWVECSLILCIRWASGGHQVGGVLSHPVHQVGIRWVECEAHPVHQVGGV